MVWLVIAAAAVLFIVLSLREKSGVTTDGWERSTRGNLTTIYRGRRVTIFQLDGLWKFCVSDPEDVARPYYSETFPTEHQAREAAMAFADGHKRERRAGGIIAKNSSAQQQWRTAVADIRQNKDSPEQLFAAVDRLARAFVEIVSKDSFSYREAVALSRDTEALEEFIYSITTNAELGADPRYRLFKIAHGAMESLDDTAGKVVVEKSGLTP